MIAISTKINGAVQQKYQPRFIDIEYTVPWTTSHLTLDGMVKSLESMSSEHLDVIYTPSYHLLKRYITEHKKDHSWVTKTSDPQCNGGNHTQRDSNTVHLQNILNTTINLAKVGHQDLNLCLAQILPHFQN